MSRSRKVLESSEKSGTAAPNLDGLFVWLEAELAAQRAAIAKQLEEQHRGFILDVNARLTHSSSTDSMTSEMQTGARLKTQIGPAYPSSIGRPLVEVAAPSGDVNVLLDTTWSSINSKPESKASSIPEDKCSSFTAEKHLRRNKTLSHEMSALFLLEGWDSQSEIDNVSLVEEETHHRDTLLKGYRKLQQAVMSTSFDFFFGVIIVINSFSIMAELEYVGQQRMVSLGLVESSSEVWESSPEVDAFFRLLGVTFAAFFVIELTLRLLVKGPSFLRKVENWLDVALVASAIIEQMNMQVTFDLSFLRVLRIAKLVRLLQVVRTMKFFESLRILVKAVAGSLQALFWSFVLLLLIESVAAMFMVQMLSQVILDDTRDREFRVFVFKYFGTTLRALLSMFEITMAPGTWAKVGRPLIEYVHPMYGLFFIAYVGGVTFAVVRVITALFLRQTLSIATTDEALMCQEKVMQKRKYTESIRQIFANADKSGEGMLSWTEFSALLDDAKMQAWLSALELDVHEAEGIFKLLDDGDGTLTLDEFLSGVFRLKGTAKQVDVVTIMYENQKIKKGLTELQYLLEKVVDNIGENAKREVDSSSSYHATCSEVAIRCT